MTDRTPEDDGDFAKGCALGLLISGAMWAALLIAWKAIT